MLSPPSIITDCGETTRDPEKQIKDNRSGWQPSRTALRWLNTVSRPVSGSACFKLNKQTWRRKKQWYTEDDFSKSTH